MEQQIYLIGLNYRTAGVEVRERFALTDHCSKETWAIPLSASENGKATLEESLILSTCNRVEILVVGQGDVPGLVLDYWASAKGRKIAELAPYVYVHRGREAISHLFTVASSLDSMVLGEPQILGQLKGAYRKATLSGTTKTIINRLLHKSFSVAKRVRTETGIAASAVSISYAAVELAKRIFGDMSQYQAMLIGAGEMAELAATHLLQAGIRKVKVCNRTYERARELADEFRGEAVPFEQLHDHLADVDIIISSTGSPEAIIRARDIKDVLKRRKFRPMFFIDIAVPRDIDPDVNNLDNVYLYDIDDLKEVVEENLAHRRVEAQKAQDIVEDEVNAFTFWLESLELQPTIVDLLSHFETHAQEELQRTLKRLGPVNQETREALEAMLNGLLRKLSHEPITFLKEAPSETSSRNVELIRRMFGLDEEHPAGRCTRRVHRNEPQSS